MGYSIKVLNTEKFNKLPYNYVDRALGLADVSKNQVYVRDTCLKELNSYLIDHEVDHLVEEVPTDEIDGVRYAFKSGLTNLFKPVTSAVSGIGNFIGKGVQGLGNALLP